MQSINPFDKWKLGWGASLPSAQTANPSDKLLPANYANPGTDANTLKDSLTQSKGTLVEFPRHLFIPEGAQGIDITRVCNVLPGTIRESLMSFEAPDGGMTVLISYGVFTDTEFAQFVEFRPEVDGTRIFPFHGDPNNDFKINIGTGPDLSNNSLKSGHTILQPKQVLDWKVTNTDVLTRVMGVRTVGYFISSQLLEATRFGG